MDRRPASDLYTLGGLFKEIELCQSGISNFQFFTLVSNLLYKVRDYTDLKIEKEMGMNSSFLILYTKLNNAAEEMPDTSVKKQVIEDLKTEIRNIETKLLTNFSIKTIAFPESEHINVQFLIREPWRLFSDEEILYKIPQSITEDLILFCQCYAYGIYTSSMIHILKATENYNIYFYNKISGKRPLPSIKWGDLISRTQTKLREIDSSNSGFKNLIDSLSNLKQNHRIEIIHFNRVIYDEDEAYRIFENCRILISKMFYILKHRFPD